MTLFRLTGATLGLALLAAPAFAQTTTSPGTGGTTPAAPHGTTTPATPPAGTTAGGTAGKGPSGSLQKVQDDWRASKLVGATVFNDTGDDVGSIDDLLVGSDGKIANAVISVGGFIGIGSKLVSVPFDQLKFVESATNRGAGTSSGGSTTSTGGTASATMPTYYSIVLPGATKDSVSKMPEFKYQS